MVSNFRSCDALSHSVIGSHILSFLYKYSQGVDVSFDVENFHKEFIDDLSRKTIKLFVLAKEFEQKFGFLN